MIGDKIQRGDPSKMAHQRDRRDDIAELTHAGISQHALHIVLLTASMAPTNVVSMPTHPRR